MTERLGSGDRQRGVARITLAAVTLVLLFGGVGFSTGLIDASAQSPGGASPTGTRTTPGGSRSPGTPSSPAGTEIEFLNPSKYASPEYVSIRPDEDNMYHLVAWVAQPPPNALVEFEAVPSSSSGSPTANPIRIGQATPVGTDTFEYFWNLGEGTTPAVPDGDYLLRARLFTSSSSPSPSPSEREQVDSDEEQVRVDRTKETVEIVYPRQLQQLGGYDPDGSSGPRRPGFTVDVVTSAGAEDVRIYYSDSPPGSEPSWVTCAEQVTIAYADRFKRIGCTFPDNAQTANALAAVAINEVPQQGTVAPGTPICQTPLCTPGRTETHSGDAHRLAAPYTADPRTVSISGSTEGTRGACHELTATVLDEMNRPVWRANVDVHAAGPGDDLQFAVTDRTHPFQAPNDPNAGHDGNEFAFNCTSNPPGNTSDRRQAEHNRPGTDAQGNPVPDRKHIESKPGTTQSEASEQQGTDLEGEFLFAIRSTRAGTTDVDVWADEDDDDVNDNPQNAQGQQDSTVDPQASTTVNWPAQSPSSHSPFSPSSSSPSASSPSASSPSESGTTTSPSTTSPSSSPSTQQAATLNCEPETKTNPTNTVHTITCVVSQPGPRSGVRVDLELTAANDSDGDTRTSPDQQCTTNDNGTCTFRHGPGGFGSTAQAGTTVYRAWIDADNNDATTEADPTEGVNESQFPGQNPSEPDNTDVVEKTWQQAPLDCSPEQDSNPTGTSHTVTCRASQAGGSAPPQGTHIVAEASGANDPDGTESLDTPDFECRTNQVGECSFTHGPGAGGVGSTNLEGVTRYRAWIDIDNSNSTPEADAFEGRDDADADQTDVVDKTWTRNPTAVTIEPEADSASVGTCNAFTITVRGDNQPVSGVLVDVEQRHERANNQTNGDEPRVTFCTPRAGDGPNPSAVDQTQGDLDPPDENPDNPGTLGGETLTGTDLQGRVTIGISVEPANGSDGTGNVVVTAFYETDDDNDPEAGEPQDSSTKTWVAPESRTIECLPVTATNPVNTQHTVTCTVRDRFGDPVEGEGVTFNESGPGDFASRGTQTNENGQVTAVTTSSEGGTQSITATLDDDLQGSEPAEVDDCDRGAGTPAGAPAGACADTVSKTWVPGTTTPVQSERDVTLEAQKNRVVFNRNVTLGGTVESGETSSDACTEFVEVNILRDVVGGDDEFELFATEQTDENGTFSHSFKADVSANYVAEVEELAQCAAATSDAEPVLVKTKVALKLSKTKVPKGGRVRFVIRTAPCPRTAGDKVLLFRAIDGEFGKTGKKRTNDVCRASLTRRVRQDSLFQARWPKQAEELLAGKSRPKVVRVQNRRR